MGAEADKVVGGGKLSILDVAASAGHGGIYTGMEGQWEVRMEDGN